MIIIIIKGYIKQYIINNTEKKKILYYYSIINYYDSYYKFNEDKVTFQPSMCHTTFYMLLRKTKKRCARS